MGTNSTDVISRLESAVSAWSDELQSAHLDLERRLADAASRLANEVEGELFDTGPILEAVQSGQERVDEVQSAVSDLVEHARGLEKRLEKVESKMQGRASLEGTVAELVNRVDRLAKESGKEDSTQQLEADVSALRSQLAESKNDDALASLRKDMEALREKVGNIQPADEALVREFAKVGMEVSQLRSLLKEIGVSQDKIEAVQEEVEAEPLVVPDESDTAPVLVDSNTVSFPDTKPVHAGDITDDALKKLAFDEAGQRRRLGAILTAANAITSGQLDEALERQSNIPTSRIGTILVELGAATEITIARVLSAQLQLPYVGLQEEEIDDAAIALVSPRLARHHQCIPVSVSGDTLVLAMANPLDLIAIEDVELATRKRVNPVVATQSQVAECIDTFYGPEIEVHDEGESDQDL